MITWYRHVKYAVHAGAIVQDSCAPELAPKRVKSGLGSRPLKGPQHLVGELYLNVVRYGLLRDLILLRIGVSTRFPGLYMPPKRTGRFIIILF